MPFFSTWPAKKLLRQVGTANALEARFNPWPVLGFVPEEKTVLCQFLFFGASRKYRLPSEGVNS